MGPVVPILRLAYLFLNIYDTYKVLKFPPPSPRNGGQPSPRAMTQRKRDMKGIMTIWVLWCCIATYENAVDPLVIYFPFYDEIKSIILLFFIFTRARGAEPVYLHVIRHMIKPHTHTIDTLLETIHLFGDFLVVLISWPIQNIYMWYKGLTFTFPWNHATGDEDLQSVHTRQRSTISTGNAQDPVDGYGASQIWYPPPPAYEEEETSKDSPPPPSLPPLAPGMYPSHCSPDESRKYPSFPAAYPLSPVHDPVPQSGFRIVAPVPKRPSDVIDFHNMSSSKQNDGNQLADETRSDFHRSLLLSREFVNPNSVVRSSDQNPTRGVQLEEKTKNNKRKRKRLSVEGGEEDHDNADDVDEDCSDDEDHVGDESFTTPRVRTVAVDSDAERGDASCSEQEDTFSLQTPLLPRRNGKRTKSNITIKRHSSTATLNPTKNAQDARLRANVYPTSPPRLFPPHLAPQIITIPSGSSVRSASTTLSTLGGGDSLMTGDASEREELETPLSPAFPSPVTYPVDASSEAHPPFPIPDVDPTLTVPVDIRRKRLFPRTQATRTRSRPPTQGMAISSSSSGGANSRASSRSRGSKRSQGLPPVPRKKNVPGSGLTRPGVRPIAKGEENVPITMPIPILASDPEDFRKRKQIKDVSCADREMVTHSDSPLNKKQKVSSASLRKVPSLGPGAMPPPKQRPAAVRIAKSTSSGKSASSSNVGARRKVGFVRDDKPVVRVRSGGTGSAN